ncbi:hypothetical protein N7457_000220 [Penicillium paradoxum]|uniref:uncharacterized protein n=1 Tax=Penicillium paradoxum TaxID=176176 RepID=UPI0025481ABB|nr:uncharacterized protein N7457_000220 [Penicillium paradoxum]KAJ5793621.1 hypothetical protein N7457_000220 [Penicillium paradoxum]
MGQVPDSTRAVFYRNGPGVALMGDKLGLYKTNAHMGYMKTQTENREEGYKADGIDMPSDML